MPQLRELSQSLYRKNGFHLVTAEGLISTREFHTYLYNRSMACTQFLRHGSKPEYTPEPDAVHDILGHVPSLLNQEYAECSQLIGKGVRQANDEQLLAWDRLYWFTIEFGLIQEDNDLKVFGAGILSSYGEMKHCFSDSVERKPFNLEEVIHTDYDPTKMQDVLFIIPTIAHLKQAIKRLIQ